MAIIEHSGYYENPLLGVSHAHTSCELMYIINGELEITINKTSYRLQENDCALIICLLIQVRKA